MTKQAPAILLQILIPPTAGSKEIPPFNALPFCISAVASNRISRT
jgi:hypothetical protein